MSEIGIFLALGVSLLFSYLGVGAAYSALLQSIEPDAMRRRAISEATARMCFLWPVYLLVAILSPFWGRRG